MQKIAKYLIRVLENYVRKTTTKKETKPSKIKTAIKKSWNWILSTLHKFNKLLMQLTVYRRLMAYSFATANFILFPITWVLSLLESQKDMAEIYEIAIKKISKVAFPSHSPFEELVPVHQKLVNLLNLQDGHPTMELVSKDIIGSPDISKSDYEQTLRTIKEESEKMKIPGQVNPDQK